MGSREKRTFTFERGGGGTSSQNAPLLTFSSLRPGDSSGEYSQVPLGASIPQTKEVGADNKAIDPKKGSLGYVCMLSLTPVIILIPFALVFGLLST